MFVSTASIRQWFLLPSHLPIYKTIKSPLSPRHLQVRSKTTCDSCPMKLLLAVLLQFGVADAAPIPSWHSTNATLSRPARVRVVVGGGGINSIWNPDSEILEPFRGFGPGGVKVITAAGSNAPGDGAQLVNLMANAGISAEWIPIHDVNCAESAFDPLMVAMVERAEAIFYGGGQVQITLFALGLAHLLRG